MLQDPVNIEKKGGEKKIQTFSLVESSKCRSSITIKINTLLMIITLHRKHNEVTSRTLEHELQLFISKPKGNGKTFCFTCLFPLSHWHFFNNHTSVLTVTSRGSFCITVYNVIRVCWDAQVYFTLSLSVFSICSLLVPTISPNPFMSR